MARKAGPPSDNLYERHSDLFSENTAATSADDCGLLVPRSDRSVLVRFHFYAGNVLRGHERNDGYLDYSAAFSRWLFDFSKTHFLKITF